MRDLLIDEEIQKYSGCSLSVSGVEVTSTGWPSVPQNSIASPVYTAGDGHWRGRSDASPTDRAVIVLRDPRDMVVSLVFSMNYSHTPDGVNRLLRLPVRHAKPADRVMLGMHMLSHWAAYMRSWLGPLDPDVLVTRYESLLADEEGELARIIRFLGWPVPPAVTAEVARRHSFQARTGRKRGEENEFSHRRKGVAGDWKNHFSRSLGQLFEETFPRLLADMGYETGTDWWQGLPEVVLENVSEAVDERSRLLKVLEQHETELVVVREAAEKRLDQIKILTHNIEHIIKDRDFFQTAATDRLRVIEQQKEEIGILKKTAVAVSQPTNRGTRGTSGAARHTKDGS